MTEEVHREAEVIPEVQIVGHIMASAISPNMEDRYQVVKQLFTSYLHLYCQPRRAHHSHYMVSGHCLGEVSKGTNYSSVRYSLYRDKIPPT